MHECDAKNHILSINNIDKQLHEEFLGLKWKDIHETIMNKEDLDSFRKAVSILKAPKGTPNALYFFFTLKAIFYSLPRTVQ